MYLFLIVGVVIIFILYRYECDYFLPLIIWVGDNENRAFTSINFCQVIITKFAKTDYCFKIKLSGVMYR
jgi:hypothetical protein